MKTTIENEQKLCVACGFCCDKTLFDIAKLEENEVIPEELQQRFGKNDDGPYFNLPCPFFCEKCTIYEEKRPAVCSAFKCSLLRKVIKQEVPVDRVLKTIEDCKTQRNNLLRRWQEHAGEMIFFRDLVLKANNWEGDLTVSLKTLFFEVNLLEIALNKYFKPDDQFKQYYEIMDGSGAV